MTAIAAMDAGTIATYDRPVPRYTSYPTAAQFDGSVGPARHDAWLRDLGDRSAAIYLHVPFCNQLCWYCACNTTAVRHQGTLGEYAQALVGELELAARAAPDLVVDGVQWGGGTPSQLGADRLLAVGRRLAGLFDRRSDAEIAMEADPRYCDPALVEAMAALGVNRVSFGVQDFDTDVQRAIGRLQSPEETRGAIERLRDAGIHRVNIDLVYGLPRQTLRTLERTLALALELRPERFAIFAYAHVPWMKSRQRLIDGATLPGAADRAAMADLIAVRLQEAGYLRIGLDHYARPHDRLAVAAAAHRLRRNFQGYVADDSPWVVGVGASAISCLPGGYSQNVAQAGAYREAIAGGGFATARGVAVDGNDRLRGEIIERLMCGYAVDLRELCRRHGEEMAAFLESLPSLRPLIADGLASLDESRLEVTARGRPLVRSVCAAFDRYYTGAEGRHARGI